MGLVWFGWLSIMLPWTVITPLASCIPLGTPIVVGVAIWGVFGTPIVASTIVGSMISQIAPLKLRGIYLGLGNLMGYFGAIVGPILFGYIADVYSFDFLFVLTYLFHPYFGFLYSIHNKKYITKLLAA